MGTFCCSSLYILAGPPLAGSRFSDTFPRSVCCHLAPHCAVMPRGFHFQVFRFICPYSRCLRHGREVAAKAHVVYVLTAARPQLAAHARRCRPRFSSLVVRPSCSFPWQSQVCMVDRGRLGQSGWPDFHRFIAQQRCKDFKDFTYFLIIQRAGFALTTSAASHGCARHRLGV